MAETPESPNPPSVDPSPKQGQEFWALVALGVAALICFHPAGRGPGADPSAAAPRPRPPFRSPTSATQRAAFFPRGGRLRSGIQRPSEPAKPQSERASAMDRSQPALPGLLASPTPPSSQRQDGLDAGRPAFAPSPPLPTPQPAVGSRTASTSACAPTPPTFTRARRPCPCPCATCLDIHGKVAAVFASNDESRQRRPLLLQPRRVLRRVYVRGSLLDIQVSQPRKTSSRRRLPGAQGLPVLHRQVAPERPGPQPRWC